MQTSYTVNDFKSDQYVRWCPGCGDHALLNSIQRAMAEIGVSPDNTAVISGIGCSSRLPYYVNTQDYLVARVKGNELKLTMKRIYMDAQGEYMWNLNKDRGPRETVRINEKTLKNGPETTGTLTIRRENNQREFLDRTGYFE
jgi:hypothetical protein